MHKRNRDILLVLKVIPHNNRNARYFQKSSGLEQYVKYWLHKVLRVGIFDSVLLTSIS